MWFSGFFSYFVSHSWGIPMMKITGLSHLFKWENLHNWWLTKYFFAPLYMWYSIFLYPLLDWRCFNLNIKFRCICIVFSQLHTNKLSKIFRGLPIAALRLKTLGLKHESFSIYMWIHEWEPDFPCSFSNKLICLSFQTMTENAFI